MNEHDSQKISLLLGKIGYQEVLEGKPADLILFNTCTVRQKAHGKAFSEIGKAVAFKKASAQKTRIGVCGCVAQEEGLRLLSRFPEIDLVFGPDQIYKLPQFLDLIAEHGRPVVATELINSSEDYHFIDALPALKLKGPKAFVTIMKGCNSQCSYCIVPKVRGLEVYRPAREIIQEIEHLAEQGCKEVTLLGQNVNSYGQNSADGISFAKLIRLISENTGVEWIRFTSPHPKDCKEDLIEEFAENKKLCPHIHLPLQSGSDMILRSMKRAYNTKSYREKVAKLRAARPGIGITTDMIVGFPGETEKDFQETLDFVEEMQFDAMYSFKYSPRPDTAACEMADDVALNIKEERLARLNDLQREISRVIYERLNESVVDCLVEGFGKSVKRFLMGRTPTNKIVNFAGQEGLINDIVRVKVTKTTPFSLEGELDQHAGITGKNRI